MGCNNVNIEDFPLAVSSGDLSPSYKQIYKFGQNAVVGNSVETIWQQGGLYVYPPSATTMTVSSSDANDTSAGTGARTVQIFGLDGSYNEVSETIILNGQTAVTTTNSYLRVNRALVLTAGSGGANAGVIYVGTGTVTAGVPANKYTTINGDGTNQSLQAFWTVPAGYTAYIYQTNISTGNTSNTPAVLKTILVVKPFGGVFNTKEVITLTDGNHLQNYNFPIKVTEKSDIEFRAESSSGSVDFNVSASLNILYKQN
tara:strand:+ start:28 stop:798 length:771 start_codon:yes stop_codon:yes gene_type:complete